MKRKAMTRFLRPYILMLALTSFLLPTCGPDPITEAQTQVAEKTITPLSGELTPLPAGSIQINGAGATFPLPIYTEWTYAYSYVDPTVAINYQGIGSGGGKKAIIEGTVDFAGSDSLLKAEEYEAGKDLQMYPILAGAVVIIYNFKPARDYPVDFNVPALVLDRQTLVDIFNGTVNRWNDPKIIALNPQLATICRRLPSPLSIALMLGNDRTLHQVTNLLQP